MKSFFILLITVCVSLSLRAQDMTGQSSELIEKEIVKRPQEPKYPYSYNSENITFKNPKASITLSGTLTIPKGKGEFPAIILISGSGPQDRDGTLFEHKPFLVISDYLTKNGIAVLRYDDRGVGQSTGIFQAATSVDFASDVHSAIAYLKTRKEISKSNIGLVGHSEGGLIAPLVASNTNDVSFIVLLAGPGIIGHKIILQQIELIKRVDGENESRLQTELSFVKGLLDLIVNESDLDTNKAVLKDFLQKQKNSESEQLTKSIDAIDMLKYIISYTTPWFQYFLKYDPSSTLINVKCPVLAMNGEKDLQVSSKENLSAIKNALLQGGNTSITTKELPNLNHLFQEAKTGSPAEYSLIEQTFSPNALEEIKNWIKSKVK